VGIGENLSISIRVKNESNVPFNGGRIHVLSDAYFIQCSVPIDPIGNYDEKMISFTKVEVKGGRYVDDLPPTIKLRITENGGKFQTDTSVNLIMQLFCKNLSLKKNEKANFFNILLFGIAGATKSSFVNTISTLLSENDRIQQIAAVGGGSSHTSISLMTYPLEKTRIRLWDTWGLTPQTYVSGELDQILDGVLPANWKMDLNIDKFRNVLDSNRDTRSERQIHGILYFLPQASLSDPNKEPERKMMKEFFSQLSRKGYNPLLMLTKVDEVNKNVRSTPNGNFSDLKDLTEKASKIFNIGTNRVFYNINYISEQQRTFEIDRMTYKILERVVENAEGFIKSKYPDIVVQSVIEPSSPKRPEDSFIF